MDYLDDTTQDLVGYATRAPALQLRGLEAETLILASPRMGNKLLGKMYGCI
jgi:hypothetical protein